jgi:hypothetical protein
MNPQTLAKRKYTKKSSVIENVPRTLPEPRQKKTKSNVIISNHKSNKKMREINKITKNTLKTIEKNFQNLIDVKVSYQYMKNDILNNAKIPDDEKINIFMQVYNRLIQHHNNKLENITQTKKQIQNEILPHYVEEEAKFKKQNRGNLKPYHVSITVNERNEKKMVVGFGILQ